MSLNVWDREKWFLIAFLGWCWYVRDTKAMHFACCLLWLCLNIYFKRTIWCSSLDPWMHCYFLKLGCFCLKIFKRWLVYNYVHLWGSLRHVEAIEKSKQHWAIWMCVEVGSARVSSVYLVPTGCHFYRSVGLWSQSAALFFHLSVPDDTPSLKLTWNFWTWMIFLIIL